MPSVPIKRLSLSLDSESLPTDIRVGVLINGRRVLDDVAAPGEDWSRNIELPDLGNEGLLSIEIDSDTYVVRPCTEDSRCPHRIASQRIDPI